MVQLNINFSVFRGDLFLWQASLTTFDQEIFSQFELHTLNFFIKLCSVCNNWTIFLFLLSKQKTFSGIIFSVNFFFAKNLAGLLQGYLQGFCRAICRAFATFNFANCRPRQTYFITSDFFSERSFTYTPNLACR